MLQIERFPTTAQGYDRLEQLVNKACELADSHAGCEAKIVGGQFAVFHDDLTPLVRVARYQSIQDGKSVHISFDNEHPLTREFKEFVNGTKRMATVA